MTDLWLPILLRTGLTFGVLLALTRLTGKKQLSQSTFFDFITAIAIGDIAADKLVDPEEPLLPWIGASVLWFGLILALDLLVLKSRRTAKLLEGEPTVLIENGRIREKGLRASFLRLDELMAHLREKGYFSPSEVEFAVFETDGSVSVLPRSQYRPVTPKDLNIPTRYEGMARELVMEGQVIEANLRAMKLDRGWLLTELNRQGYAGPEEVLYACLESSGRLYVDGYRDPIAGTRVTVRDYTGPH